MAVHYLCHQTAKYSNTMHIRLYKYVGVAINDTDEKKAGPRYGSSFSCMPPTISRQSYLVPASRIAAEIFLERLAGLSLLANDAPGAAAGGSDEGIDDLFHVRLLDCTTDNGGAYDNDCYARVI